jgi:hypothetical protein
MTYSPPPCPYCGDPTEFCDSARVYGRSFGRILICANYPRCDAFVGCHKDSGMPKGTLARAPLREARKRAHAAFDPLWLGEARQMRRHDAYAWLSYATGIPFDQCHIGMMNEDQCALVVKVCKERNQP